MGLQLVGRPSEYTPEIAEEILSLMFEGKMLIEICGLPNMPAYTTVGRWLFAHEDFAALYARAREHTGDYIAQEALLIADTPESGQIVVESDKDGKKVTTADMTDHRRLRVDARKWLASKLAPHKYGDRVALQALDDKGKPARMGGVIVIIDGAPAPRKGEL